MITCHLVMFNNNIVAYRNDLPVPLQEETAAALIKNTEDTTVVMGSKTFAFSGQFIPNRKYAILTRLANKVPRGVKHISSIQEMEDATSEDFSIIGGISTIKSCLPIADLFVVYKVDKDVEGDTTFWIPETFIEFNTTFLTEDQREIIYEPMAN